MTETKGLVSVIIPFHNRERFLAEAIESVLQQSYADWELILVDDGSSDRSQQIAQSYAQGTPEKIRYIHHSNHQHVGVTRSRNLGASFGSGEILAFLDSDDVWLPRKLEHQVSLMNSQPAAALVYGPSEYWYDWDSRRPETRQNQFPPVAPGGRLYFPPGLLIDSFPLGNFGAPCTSSCLIRRRAFEQVRGWDEEFSAATFQLYEDIALFSKIYLAFPVFVTDQCLERYRRHSQSMWQRSLENDDDEHARAFYFRWLREYLIQHPVANSEILKRVRRKAWPYWIPLPNKVTRLLRRCANRLSR